MGIIILKRHKPPAGYREISIAELRQEQRKSSDTVSQSKIDAEAKESRIRSDNHQKPQW